jgi:hypothetical protein
MSVSGSISASGSVKESKAAGLGTAAAPVSLAASFGLVDGTGGTKVDRAYSALRHLAGGANEDLVVSSAGTLKTALGDAFQLVKLKAVVIQNPAGSPADLTITGTVLFVGTGGGVVVPPGGFVAFASPTGRAITVGTADKVNVAAGAGAGQDYSVLLVGASA